MTQTPTAHTPAQEQARAQFTVPAQHPMVTVLGSGDSLLRVIEKAFPAADIHVRGNEISAVGDPADVALISRVFDEMMLVLRTGQPMTEDAVERSIAMLKASENGESDGQETPAEVLTQNILSSRGRTIRPKTLNQKRYVDAIDKHTVVFGIGPAGTGKTYLAMAKAVQALQSKQVNRIILTRPAVEAGERLGFLPGTLLREDRPVSAPALRRAARHARPGLDPAADGGGDHRGGAAGVHAWPDPQRRLHHPGRGPEHEPRTDEDVPHPPRLRIEDRDHG
ncbi:hypothetical protein GCM10011428_50310 [Streptomyces violaceus]